jgi:hypothetical protein
MKKVVEIPKILRNFPLKTQNFTQNALTGSAHRPGKKGEKNTKKTSATLWAATSAPNAPDISAPWSSTTWKEIPASSKVENRNLISQAAGLCIGEQE